jgi:hypothetical protein
MKSKAEQAQRQAEQFTQQRALEIQTVRSVDSTLQPRILALQTQLRDVEDRCAIAEDKARRFQHSYNQEHKKLLKISRLITKFI